MKANVATSPDLLLIFGTPLKVPGIQTLVKQFAKIVHSRKRGQVIFVNNTAPSESVWGGVIDIWIEVDCDEFVASLREHRADIFLTLPELKIRKDEAAAKKSEAANKRKAGKAKANRNAIEEPVEESIEDDSVSNNRKDTFQKATTGRAVSEKHLESTKVTSNRRLRAQVETQSPESTGSQRKENTIEAAENIGNHFTPINKPTTSNDFVAFDDVSPFTSLTINKPVKHGQAATNYVDTAKGNVARKHKPRNKTQVISMNGGEVVPNITSADMALKKSNVAEMEEDDDHTPQSSLKSTISPSTPKHKRSKLKPFEEIDIIDLTTPPKKTSTTTRQHGLGLTGSEVIDLITPPRAATAISKRHSTKRKAVEVEDNENPGGNNQLSTPPSSGKRAKTTRSTPPALSGSNRTLQELGSETHKSPSGRRDPAARVTRASNKAKNWIGMDNSDDEKGPVRRRGKTQRDVAQRLARRRHLTTDDLDVIWKEQDYAGDW
ncbi:MAG: hypothetical protein MMC23_001306 [Stictis urceolatum]|nr:hypothetical protein [Stictis urceolata]